MIQFPVAPLYLFSQSISQLDLPEYFVTRSKYMTSGSSVLDRIAKYKDRS